MSATAEERNRTMVIGAFDTLANRRDFVAAQHFWARLRMFADTFPTRA
jgi:hypothetical protein